MAESPGKSLFDSLDDYERLQDLIDSGEAEAQHLECKAPSGSEFGRDQRVSLGRAISGFANSGGGVILWGMQTVKHQGGLDVLTQTTPIGNIARFLQHVDRASGRAVEPFVEGITHRILKERPSNRAGVLVTFIPPNDGDPVRTVDDHTFYMRSGDEFVSMPYEVLRRMFAGAAGPIIEPIFDDRIVKANEDEWEIPFIVTNQSSAVGRDIRINITVENPEACETIRATEP